MLTKIADIKKALNAGAVQSAIALALTLPDICRQVEYGNSGSVTNGYIKWVNTYVDLSPLHCGFGTESAEIDGTVIYGLRCSFLHSGSDDIKGQGVAKKHTITDFKLATPNTLPNGGAYTYRVNASIVETKIDAKILCDLLCDAAEKYYHSRANKAEFDAYTWI